MGLLVIHSEPSGGEDVGLSGGECLCAPNARAGIHARVIIVIRQGMGSSRREQAGYRTKRAQGQRLKVFAIALIILPMSAT